MKVLHIDTEMSWRGGENQIRLLLEHAQDKGVEWHLAAPVGSQAILRMERFAKTCAVPMKGLAQLSAARSLADYCRREKIDLIDCQTSRAHQLGLLIKYLVPGVKLVVHRRVDFAPGASIFNRFKYINQKIDRYVAISQAIGDILIDYGVPREKIAVVRSAVDSSPFQGHDRNAARAKLEKELGLDLPASTPIIGNVAYLTEQKGHETLVRALGKLEERNIPFFAFIAGDGELRAKNEALAKELKIEAKLRFLGIRQDVPELLAASDIFAMSSNDEGLGTSLLDAAHSGACLVATSVGGIPEIILHRQTGLLSPARDGSAFANNLAEVILDPNLRQTLAKAAREHVERLFSLSSMVEGNLKIYRQLTGQS